MVVVAIPSRGVSPLLVVCFILFIYFLVLCIDPPSPPSNGNISCNFTGVPHYEDQCSFSCDPGYELTGSSIRQCLSNESWSGANVTCDILYCNNLTDLVDNSVLVSNCGSEFGSVCCLGCITGYRVVGNNTFTCDIVNNGVKWRNNGDFQCDIGIHCIFLTVLYFSVPSNLYRRFGITI